LNPPKKFPKLLDGAKYCQKVQISVLYGATKSQTDDRQTAHAIIRM